ncbi:MAG: alpha-L-fucosidase [Alistipes sp.]|nr:alpha-L-fucosidase [Alistipes sp.]
MKKTLLVALFAMLAIGGISAQEYRPTKANLRSRKEFAEDRFGIFIHWGLYSVYGQGEWYMQNAGLDRDEYAKVADAFYPHRFNAKKWVSLVKASGAKYICITTRHHDSFSMWDTKYSDYNIVDATPFKRDILKEIAKECKKQDIALHLYYSHADWYRDDYPRGRTAKNVTGRDSTRISWDNYYKFMNRQLTELLNNYGKVRAIWFDGWWDHDEDEVPFDWHLTEQYKLVHKLQPRCLVANNHHQTPFPGEDIQIFERDLPGENEYGLSGQEVSKLPLETCQTMNGMWGYKVADQNYKSTDELIRYLVSTAGKGANLLLNVGPQPNGEIPFAAQERLRAMGKWLKANGETIYGTQAGDIPQQEWGCTTRKGDKLYVHIFELEGDELRLPLQCNVVDAKVFGKSKKVPFRVEEGEVVLTVGNVPAIADYIIEVKTTTAPVKKPAKQKKAKEEAPAEVEQEVENAEAEAVEATEEAAPEATEEAAPEAVESVVPAENVEVVETAEQPAEQNVEAQVAE